MDITKDIARLLALAKKWAKWMLRPEFRRQEKKEKSAFKAFKTRSEKLWSDRPELPKKKKTVLVMSSGLTDTIGVELAFLESMRAVGFNVVVLMLFRDEWLIAYYKQWDITNLIFWEDYIDSTDAVNLPHFETFEDVLDFEVMGTKAGKYAASQVMRARRIGRFDPDDNEIWQILLDNLRAGAQAAVGASEILSHIKPDTVLFNDRGYSPFGQMFDLCVAQGVDTLQWCNAHKDNALLLKRYHADNSSMHYTALSDDTWNFVQEMPWNETLATQVEEELFKNYESGKWFSEVGTQFHKSIRSADELKKHLELDPKKKVAVIFAHMFWDATFFYGRDIFADYEDWFVQTIRAAIDNTDMNWIVKVHPANLTKDHRDGFKGESSELTAIRKHFGALPSHITVLEADSEINTYSLFSLMDYCVTVRGTIGVEASSFGIPVLTAGTGRYDQLGFTIDSDSTDEYLKRLSILQTIEPLSPAQHELAQRYAHAVLLMRPLILQSVLLEFEHNEEATPKVTFEINSVKELVEAPDMKAFAEWAFCSTAEDFLYEA